MTKIASKIMIFAAKINSKCCFDQKSFRKSLQNAFSTDNVFELGYRIDAPPPVKFILYKSKVVPAHTLVLHHITHKLFFRNVKRFKG